MNKLLLPVLAVLLACAAPVRANDEGDHDENGEMHEMHGMNEMHEHKLDPEGMKKHLGLSDDQAVKVKKAWEDHAAAVKPLREQRRDQLKKLHEQVEAKASDAEIKATLDALEQTQKSFGAAHDKMKADIEAALTPTQQAKMVLGIEHRMHERMEKRRHGKGGAMGQGGEKGAGDGSGAGDEKKDE